jgi:two-component system phosphate regulon sensor histidine kinase PhoR
MPYEDFPSPVAPQAGSRLWTAGASTGIAIAVLLCLAVYQQDLAPWLLAGAALTGLTAWLLNRNPPVSPAASPESGMAPSGSAEEAESSLLEGVFEALVDPVLVVSGVSSAKGACWSRSCGIRRCLRPWMRPCSAA